MHKAEDFRGHAWMGFSEALRRGLGNVMAQTFDLRVAGAFQSLGETPDLLRADP
jgi:hypothetical protein